MILNWGKVLGCPYNESPTALGSVLGPWIFVNSNVAMLQVGLCASAISLRYHWVSGRGPIPDFCPTPTTVMKHSIAEDIAS